MKSAQIQVGEGMSGRGQWVWWEGSDGCKEEHLYVTCRWVCMAGSKDCSWSSGGGGCVCMGACQLVPLPVPSPFPIPFPQPPTSSMLGSAMPTLSRRMLWTRWRGGRGTVWAVTCSTLQPSPPCGPSCTVCSGGSSVWYSDSLCPDCAIRVLIVQSES